MHDILPPKGRCSESRAIFIFIFWEMNHNYYLVNVRDRDIVALED